MALGKAKLAIGGTALALVAAAGIGFSQGPVEPPPLTVYLTPT
jgi:hypothetical protein